MTFKYFYVEIYENWCNLIIQWTWCAALITDVEEIK